MLRPRMPPRARKRACRTLAMNAARPSLLKPSRLISAPAAGQAEHARLRIAGLRQRRHRADLDEAEAHRAEGVDAAAVLVEPGGQADAVRESAARRSSPGRATRGCSISATSGVRWIAASAASVRSCACSGSSPNRKGRASGKGMSGMTGADSGIAVHTSRRDPPWPSSASRRTPSATSPSPPIACGARRPSARCITSTSRPRRCRAS